VPLAKVAIFVVSSVFMTVVGRGDGAALRLSHAQFRVQPADLVPGRDHGAARRHASGCGVRCSAWCR
jgi:hypothetical protein